METPGGGNAEKPAGGRAAARGEYEIDRGLALARRFCWRRPVTIGHRFEIFPERRLIVLRYRGNFTLGELMETTRRLWDDGRYSESYDGMIDLSDGRLNVTMADFKAFLTFLLTQKQLSTGRWVAVTESPLATACGLLYQRAAGRRHVFEVFSTCDAAWAFLGQDGGGIELPWAREAGGRN